MSKYKPKIGTCAICGKYGNVTSEHIPPKNIFLKPRPSNTITVYTCDQHNQDTKKDDEYFRVYIAAASMPNTDLMNLWKQKVVGSTFKRSPALKKKIQKDQDIIKDYHHKNPITTWNGIAIPPEYSDLLVSFEADRINRVVEKIIRCLFYYHTKNFMASETNFYISNEPIDSNKFEEAVKKGNVGLVGGDKGEFIYWFDINNNFSEWILLFYFTQHFVVKTSYSKVLSSQSS